MNIRAYRTASDHDELREGIKSIARCMLTASHYNNLSDEVFENYLNEILALLDKPLPTNEEIHIQIIHCLYGGGSVPQLEKWLKEKFQK